MIKKIRSLGVGVKGFLFHNTSTRQTITKNAFWLTVSNVGGRLLRAIIIIYAARVLGASEWGVFSYAITLVTFFTIFTDVGISPMLIRETAKFKENPEERSKFLSAALALKSLLLLCGIIAILLFSPLLGLEAGVKAILPIAIAIFIFDTFRELGFSLIRAIEKTEREAMLYLFTNAAIVIFGFIFLSASETVVSFTYAYAVGTGLGMVATIFNLRKYFFGIFTKFSWGTAKYILHSGWPFAVSAILAVLMIDTDILMIGWLRSSEEVGFYSAAHRIIQILYLLPAVLSTSLLPTFSRLAEKEGEKMRLGLERVLGLIYLAAIPTAIGGAILGKEIIGLIFGQEYITAASSFRVLTITILISFPAVILNNVIFAHNKQKQVMSYAAIGGFSNAILNLIFIPKFGMLGSAVVTFVAQFLANIYLWRATKKIAPFRVLPHLKKIIAAAAIMAAFVIVLSVLSVPVLANIGLAIPLYFALLYTFREPLLNEAKLVFSNDRNPTTTAAL